MIIIMTRLLGLIIITLVLATLTGIGLLVDWPTTYVAFGSWCGGVTFVLTLQESMHVQAART